MARVQVLEKDDIWLRYDKKLESLLKEQQKNGPMLPVVDVSRYYAVLYARSHSDGDLRQLGAWLDSQLEERRFAQVLDLVYGIVEVFG